MEDLFGNSTHSAPKQNPVQMEERERQVLKHIAWFILPVNYDIITRITDRFRMNRKECKDLVAKLLDENKLIERSNNMLFWSGTVYELFPPLHLELLWEMKDEPVTVYSSNEPLYRNYTWTVDIKQVIKWRELLAELPVAEKLLTFPPMDNGRAIFNLCSYMPFDPHWSKYFDRLPHTFLITYFQNQYTMWMNSLYVPPFDFIQRVYLCNPRFGIEFQSNIIESLSFFTYVLPGKIEHILERVSFNFEGGMCAHALDLQYCGLYKEAVSQYQEALKIVGTHLFQNPFYNVAYVVALTRLDTEASKKKLNVLLKKKDIQTEWSHLPVLIAIMQALHLPMDVLIENFSGYYYACTPLVRVLSVLLLKHYHLSDCPFAQTDKVYESLSSDSLKLLRFEFSQNISPFQDEFEALQKEIGVEPLLPPCRTTQEWERTLERLMDLAGNIQGESGKGETAVSTSRIVYNVGPHPSITPRLQKSKDGITWSKGRDIALATFKQQNMPEMNDTDRRVATCVHAYSTGWGNSVYYEVDVPKAFAILAGYPLLFLDNSPGVPVVITKESPQVIVTKTKEGFHVESNLKAEDYSSGMVLQKENDQLYRVVEVSTKQREILNTLKRTPDFPKNAEGELSKVLGHLGQSITVHSDLLQDTASLKSVKGSSSITVQLQPMGDGVKVELYAKPFVDHPPYCKAGEGAASIIGVIKGERVQAVRNLKKEKEHFQHISQLLKEVSGDQTVTDVAFFDDYYQCLGLIEQLRELTGISRTEWPEGVKFTVNRSAGFSQLKLGLRSVGQWFEVDGELEVDGKAKIKIKDLLEKIRQSKGRFIALTDSDFLALSNQLRKQLTELDNLLFSQKNKLQMSSLNLPLLGEMEQAGMVLKKDKACAELQKRMEEAGQETFSVPKMLQAELRPYQQDGYQWMSRLAHWGAGACLADDMGLGKTIQAIGLMLARARQGASLVIAPASVLLNWKAEIERFAPALNSIVMYANGDRKQLLEQASEFDVVLTTYGLLINEVEALSGKEWNIIVLDEAHTIKNKETKMAKAAMELKGGFRLLLTGTPLQNHLGEIWTLFQFANPGLLGSFQQFNERFIQPIEKDGDKLRQKQLKKILSPFLLRRTKAEVLDELPEKTEITLSVELSKDERALYDHLREQALLNLEDGSNTPIQTLAEITRLRQAACHPALVNPKLELSSSKTEAFLRLVDELIDSRHRALVFSQFTSHLALVRKELDSRGIEYLYLDGSLSVNERTTLVRQFQTGEQPLFLISLKAGGTGLNLTAADYVIHLDPWWNPAVEDQASDRAHRIGQTRPVTIYRLITAQTIEEKIIRLHQTKKSLADSLLDGSDMAHKLSKEEMLELLREAN